MVNDCSTDLLFALANSDKYVFFLFKALTGKSVLMCGFGQSNISDGEIILTNFLPRRNKGQTLTPTSITSFLTTVMDFATVV